jgi:hypothetical protein
LKMWPIPEIDSWTQTSGTKAELQEGSVVLIWYRSHLQLMRQAWS